MRSKGMVVLAGLVLAGGVTAYVVADRSTPPRPAELLAGAPSDAGGEPDCGAEVAKGSTASQEAGGGESRPASDGTPSAETAARAEAAARSEQPTSEDPLGGLAPCSEGEPE